MDVSEKIDYSLTGAVSIEAQAGMPKVVHVAGYV